MKIGIICDGDAEAIALEKITSRLTHDGTTILKPIYADMQPKATPAQIANASKEAFIYLTKREVDKVVVIIDFEDRNGCCPQHAEEIRMAMQKCGKNNISVVVKNRKFENWLIADPVNVCRLKKFGRFSEKSKNIIPNKADSVLDAESLLNSICGEMRYEKRKDAIQISGQINILDAAKNSRSFRKFLRELEVPKYLAQSKKP